MKRISRIFKIVFLLFMSMLIILSLAAFLLQDRIINLITESLNKQLLTKFEYGKTNLSFISNWPKATVRINDLLVHSSASFNSKQFPDIGADTLLFARNAEIEFSITDIIAGKYKIDRITLSKGTIRLLTDSDGIVNYEITKDEGKGEEDNFEINLNSIVADDITARYINLESEIGIAGRILKSRLKSRFGADKTDFRAEGDLVLDSAEISSFRIKNGLNSGFNIDLEANESLLTIKNGALRTDNYRFGISGTYNYTGLINLIINGENLDVSEISSLLNEKYRIEKYGFTPSGKFDAICTITGPMTKTESPDISVGFSLSDGAITRVGKTVGIDQIKIEGLFGNKAITDTSRAGIIGLSEISFLLGDSQYKGSLSARMTDTISLELLLNAAVKPSDLKDFFNLDAIKNTSGSVNADLKLNGSFAPGSKISLLLLLSQNSFSDFDFSDFSLTLAGNEFSIADVNGKLNISDTITFRSLSLNYNENKVKIDGYLNGLNDWYTDSLGVLEGKLDLAFASLNPDKLLSSPFNKNSSKSTGSVRKFPDDIKLAVSLSADDFTFRGFTGSKLVASGVYSSPRLIVNNLTINALEGFISGSGFIHQNSSLSLICKGDLVLDKVNIKDSFTTFRDFGQTFIKAENLEGLLSGNVSFLLPVDTALNVNSKEISAEGRYTIYNGSLLNFMPLEELSSFIEISELRNIRFETLENDFFIRNNYLYTPQMDIRSSAADLALNGKHSFDNAYEYHIRVRLSDVLSRKIGKPKPNTTEFGAVTDDGLGRTSLMLKITGNDEDFKVAYDAKAAGDKIKSDIRNERENLKSILKEEYGMFKNDASVPSTKTEKSTTPRFKIEWGSNDTIPEEEKPAETVKVNSVKSLFRKKK